MSSVRACRALAKGAAGDATVDQVASGDAHRRKHCRDRGAGQDRVDGITGGQQHFLAAGDVGGDDVQRDRRVLEPLEVDVLADEPAQRPVRAQRRRPTEDRGTEPGGLERKHVATSQRCPDLGQLVQRRFTDTAPGDVGGVERADGGANQQVRSDSSGGEGLEHADLDGSQAPAARQHEGRRHRGLTPGWRAGKAVARRARVSAPSSNPKSRRAMS